MKPRNLDRLRYGYRPFQLRFKSRTGNFVKACIYAATYRSRVYSRRCQIRLTDNKFPQQQVSEAKEEAPTKILTEAKQASQIVMQ
jgi:hypothetical protein